MTFGFEAAEQASIEIDANSGWPALSTEQFRQQRRIPEHYDEATLADSLYRSVAEVQQQILSYLMKQGATNTDVTSFTLTDGVPDFSEQQISIYRGAVYARSHADLMSYFSAVDQKSSGNNKAQDTEQQSVLLGHSNRGIRLLLGLGRAGVHAL